ncbi:hypothetical protein L1987_23252 [Smallanthus sonchifolius]|uniref:Uncharacterized protein n=1 Tax=Smallanthus sonchifolius TaxID=185202 RepID=A0ACB9IIL3_9ASTR|nr:hypothetical protein L1987_23252 [Smallanthus sonchifolius]
MKVGNYGWRVYEGPTLFSPQQPFGGNTSADSINPIFPVMGYSHYDVKKNEGSASITGGRDYRSNTDPCMYGRSICNCHVGGSETPRNSGNFTSNKIPFTCASDSPLPCSIVPESSFPALGYNFSFGQDNNEDVYLLTSSGVYKIVAPSRCNYACAIKKKTTDPDQNSMSSPLSANMLKGSIKNLMFLLVVCLLLV